jgi:hypothetical protein
MSAFDAFWHLVGLFMPALATGVIAATAAKWLWRRELTSISWRRLAVWPVAAGSLALLAGLMLLGRDGRMLSYVGMVVVSALALWWVAFGPRRR